MSHRNNKLKIHARWMATFELKKEFVKGMDDEIIKSKLNKILSELSTFIFGYNFNFVDYPYLTDIVLEIIKRKQPNPDADINDLLEKIE